MRMYRVVCGEGERSKAAYTCFHVPRTIYVAPGFDPMRCIIDRSRRQIERHRMRKNR